MTAPCPHTDERPLDIQASADRLGIRVNFLRKLVYQRRITYLKVEALVCFRATANSSLPARVKHSTGRPT